MMELNSFDHSLGTRKASASYHHVNNELFTVQTKTDIFYIFDLNNYKRKKSSAYSFKYDNLLKTLLLTKKKSWKNTRIIYVRCKIILVEMWYCQAKYKLRFRKTWVCWWTTSLWQFVILDFKLCKSGQFDQKLHNGLTYVNCICRTKGLASHDDRNTKCFQRESVNKFN